MKSRIDGKRGQKGVKNGLKMPFSKNNVYKHLISVQNMVLSGKYHSRRQIKRYILPFCTIGTDLLVQKGLFWVLKRVQMPIFCNNIYKIPCNGTKPGVIRKISFPATYREIYLTVLYNRYGSTGPKMYFWVLKGVKMPIFYNNVYKTPYNSTKPGIMGNISFQTRNRKIYLTILHNRYGSTSS